jgi:hypothetical protein
MAVSPWAFNLSWRDNSNNESGFRIERRTGSGAWSRIATVGADETAYSDSGLNSVTAYTYRIRSYTGSGNSVYSNVANAHTCVPISEIGMGTSLNGALHTTAAPAAPSQLTAIPLPSSRLTLNWRDKSNNETAFRIYRKIESGAWSQIAKVGADTTAFVDTGLRSSTA